MATIDHLEAARPAWSPSASGFPATDEAVEEYVGRHRKPGGRALSLLRMFYMGRHRTR